LILSTTGKAVLVTLLVVVAATTIFIGTRRAGSTSNASTTGVDGAWDGGATMAARSSGNNCVMTPCESTACDACTTQNCTPPTDGCGRFDDPSDARVCEDLYSCITDPANHCTNQGDPVRCWCGTNPTTCLGNPTGPLAANGPCLRQIFAAAKTTDPGVIRQRFVDAVFPIGRAVRLSSCRGSFCSSECAVP
jgi:hypothetical protein